MTHNVIISIGCIYKPLKSIPLISTYNGLRDYTIDILYKLDTQLILNSEAKRRGY